jgi:FHS family L-fucose permease-like MFS transporter
MALFGGAVAPLCMGAIADRVGISAAYLVPTVCFAIVFGFAMFNRRQSSLVSQ